MKIFIDSANPEDVFEAYETGMVDGVTTNPSLAVKAGIPYRQAVEVIVKEVHGPVSLEVLSTDFEGMVREGKELIKFGKNVVVKIPMGIDGVRATRTLSQMGVAVNMTLIFSANQALLAAKSGARFISPFVGREDDAGFAGMEEVEQMRQILDNYNFESEIIVASVRSPMHVEQAAILGADICTLPPDIFWKLFNHPMTDIGLDKFLTDFENAGIEPLV